MSGRAGAGPGSEAMGTARNGGGGAGAPLGAGQLTSLVLAGVGGQGSILAMRVIARAVALGGQRVVTSEVHGMAQRGGTVVTAVRYGPRVLAPKVPAGEADVLIAFEELEAMRYLPLLRSEGVVVVNRQRIAPSIESLKGAPYPADPVARMRATGRRVIPVAALEIADELGNIRFVNTVVLGALSAVLPLPRAHWEEAIRLEVPPRTVEGNLRAFARGLAAAEAEVGTRAPAAKAGAVPGATRAEDAEARP